MQVEFRFIDNQIRMLIVVQMRQEDEQFLDPMTFVSIKPIRIADFAKHSPRNEISRVHSRMILRLNRWLSVAST